MENDRKVQNRQKDGDVEKVLEWDGTGEMPEEMKKR